MAIDDEQAPPPQAIRPHDSRRIIAESWDGPIPPPAIMEQLDRLVPGSAERIMNDYMARSEHARAIERMEAEDNREETRALSFDVRLARLAATLFPYGGLGFATYFAAHGWLTLAGIVATTTIGSVVVATLARRSDPPR